MSSLARQLSHVGLLERLPPAYRLIVLLSYRLPDVAHEFPYPLVVPHGLSNIARPPVVPRRILREARPQLIFLLSYCLPDVPHEFPCPPVVPHRLPNIARAPDVPREFPRPPVVPHRLLRDARPPVFPM